MTSLAYSHVTARKKHKNLEKRIIATVFFSIILFLAYYAYLSSNKPPAFQLKAAIVDQLSLTFPNQTFVQTATNMLEKAGYSVDYYPGEEVTVDCYRSLPAGAYKIVILRVHCGHWPDRQAISFFTSEGYSESEYVEDQQADRLHRVFYVYPAPEGTPSYFSITPLFVKDAMNGRFNETTVIMMGCYGLEYPAMAEAFIQKGAKVYISWDGSVAADHTDEATVNLLKHLVLEEQTIGQAVENTVKEVGEDPTYKSQLTYYPSEAGEQKTEKG